MRKVALDEGFNRRQIRVRHSVVPGQSVLVPKNPEKAQKACAGRKQVADRAQHILTRRRKITAEARHLQSANHHSWRATPENGEQPEVLKVHESEREKADSSAQFVECKVPAEGAEQSEKPAVGERKTRRIDQQSAPAVLKRGHGKQSRVNRRQRLDVQSCRLPLGLRRNGNINEDARVLRFFLLARPSDGDRESEIFRGRPGGAALFHLGGQRSGCKRNAII